MPPAKSSEVNWSHVGERIDEYESMIFSNSRADTSSQTPTPPAIDPQQSSSYTDTPAPKIGFFSRVVNRLFRSS